MQTSETLTLQAFAKALTHLDQSLDAEIETEIIQRIGALIETANKSQPLQQRYDEALLDLIKNYEVQPRFINSSIKSSSDEILPEAINAIPNPRVRKPVHLDSTQTKKTPLEIFEENGLVGCFEGDKAPSVNHQSTISDYLTQKQKQGRL